MLRDKVILLISPQSWGNMYIAKHHYALELARLGNIVYFLNPPEPTMRLAEIKKRAVIEQSAANKNLYIIHHHLFFPYVFKFHAKKLFLSLMRFHIKSILRQIGKNPDIIWSFDLGNMYPFSFFPVNALKVFHPVDEPTNAEALKCGKDADIIFSVTTEILEKYRHFNVPAIFVHHGVPDEFFDVKKQQPETNGNIRIGVSGNFLRPDIDRETFLRIVTENEHVVFECWGAYENNQANLGTDSTGQAKHFVESLKKRPNVIFHGPVKTFQLAEGFQHMDAFFICYDINKDASKGTNYHKIMEYLSTGKVVISNNVTTYKGKPELVQMVEERTNNDKLPFLFKEVIDNLSKYNSADLRTKRIEFAKNNRYSNNIRLIEKALQDRI